MLECRGIWLSYPAAGYVLKGVTLAVDKGEVVALLGPNGAGKSTLLLSMAGLIRPDRGEVLLDGVELRKQLPQARRRIGILFQDPDDQLFNPTVKEEIAFALNQLEVSEMEKESRIAEAAELLEVQHLLERPVYALSFGEKKRVALASILVYDPEYLLLDEPVANLDPKSSSLVLRTICRLRDLGRGVLLATQDVEQAAGVADRFAVLVEGKLVWEGTVLDEDVLEEAGLLRSHVQCR